MSEGYHTSEENGCPFSELDELLCEYVDGTMDPAVRQVFEEYLRTDPALAEHVECLRHTRMLLCHYGCRLHAPQGLQARLRQQLSCEMMHTQRPLLTGAASGLRLAAAFTSAMLVMLVVGLQLGAVVQDEERRLAQERGQRIVEGQTVSGAWPVRPLPPVSMAAPAAFSALPLSSLGSGSSLVALFGPSVSLPPDARTAIAQADSHRLRRIGAAP